MKNVNVRNKLGDSGESILWALTSKNPYPPFSCVYYLVTIVTGRGENGEH